jgi:glycosyltransferase involved in cell wall biosynthesis
VKAAVGREIDRMNILMMTNTFTPFVGGVARSVEAFTAELRRMGHRVVVVAPVFDGAPESEEDVIRVPAIQHFNGSDFAVVLPVPGLLSAKLEDFRPDIVHSHHPHLLGGTAVRVASRFDCPLVFTHHTMYEHYLHYVPAHAERLREFVIRLVTGYCNLCDRVVAPSESVARILAGRGVKTSTDVVPTGVYTERFARGDGSGFRRSHGIGDRDVLAGYVGRLAPEKNLAFLARAMAGFVARSQRAHFLVVGSGPSVEEIRDVFDRARITDRLHLVGALQGQELIDAYHAMNVFVFASHTETQGMVLTEAMAAGKPVVAIDAPGIREVVRSDVNGYLLDAEDDGAFASAVRKVTALPESEATAFRDMARQTADAFSMNKTAQRLAEIYTAVLAEEAPPARDESVWSRAVEEIKAEWDLIKNIAEAATDIFKK